MSILGSEHVMDASKDRKSMVEAETKSSPRYKPLSVRRRVFTPTSPANQLLSYPPCEICIKPPLLPAPVSPSPRLKRALVAAGTRQNSRDPGNPFTNAKIRTMIALRRSTIEPTQSHDFLKFPPLSDLSKASIKG